MELVFVPRPVVIQLGLVELIELEASSFLLGIQMKQHSFCS